MSNPGKVAELFNSYFCEISKELLKEEGKKGPTHGNYQIKIKKNTNSIFVLPITESEVEKVVGSLKNKLTAGTDEPGVCSEAMHRTTKNTPNRHL